MYTCNVTLNAFVADLRLRILRELENGELPSVGVFDEAVLKEGRMKGAPQMGATRYRPHEIAVEFIFPDAKSSATIFTVRVEPPERIVFLPVPEWVVESIWQGSVSGSFHFESQAKDLVRQFASLLEPDANEAQFEAKSPTRRE